MKKRTVTPNDKQSKSINNSFCTGLFANSFSKVQDPRNSESRDSECNYLHNSDLSKKGTSNKTFVPMGAASKLRKQVVIIGGEGHGTMIAEAVQDNGERYCEYEWEIAGFCNDYHEKIDGYPVLGRIDDIPKLLALGYYFSWAVYILNHNYQTVSFFNSINIPDERWATIVHRSAFVSKSAIIEPGAFIMYGSYIGPRTVIGKCSMIKANVNIGHDVRISSLCHISMGANINSNSNIGIGAYISVGAQVMLNVNIGSYSMLGAQSLAMHNIPEGEIHVGVPARYLKKMNKE